MGNSAGSPLSGPHRRYFLAPATSCHNVGEMDPPEKLVTAPGAQGFYWGMSPSVMLVLAPPQMMVSGEERRCCTVSLLALTVEVQVAALSSACWDCNSNSRGLLKPLPSAQAH